MAPDAIIAKHIYKKILKKGISEGNLLGLKFGEELGRPDGIVD